MLPKAIDVPISSRAEQTFRFSRLKLGNWRNFASLDVELQQRVFLVGPNAAGKSNLLDVFRFLRELAAVGGSFQEAVRRRGGVSRLWSLAARKMSDVVVEVELEVLLLQPGTEGTTVRAAKDFLQVRPLLEGGASLAEAVIPMTRPEDAHQLTLFAK